MAVAFGNVSVLLRLARLEQPACKRVQMMGRMVQLGQMLPSELPTYDWMMPPPPPPYYEPEPPPVYTSTVYARQPDNTMLYILLALAAVLVLRGSGKSKRRR